MNVSFRNIDLNERPMLILKNASDQKIGVLGCLTSLDGDLKYNETSTITFEVPAFFDGQPTPFYDALVSRRVVEIPGIGQFILVNPSEVDDGITRKKTCKAYSLDYEFTFKKITIPDGVYKFWDATDGKDTVIGMIIELMPSWSIGNIPLSIANKYRMFSLDNENLYNFIKGTLQETYECVFEFDTLTRTIIIKDANADVGVDPVYFSTHNLIKSIEVAENTEDIITRLDVNGAEGVDIRSANPTGTNKIINLDYYMTPDNFSQSILDAYNEWKETVNAYEDEYFEQSIAYSVNTARLELERAVLADLQNDIKGFETQQSVLVEQYTRNKDKSATEDEYILEQLSEINEGISSKASEIDAQTQVVADVEATCSAILENLNDITKMCNFYTSYDRDTHVVSQRYTNAERILIDRYLIDGEIEDSTFVFEATERIDPIHKTMRDQDVVVKYTRWVNTELAADVVIEIGDDIVGKVRGQSSVGDDDETDDKKIIVYSLYDGTIEGEPFDEATVTIVYTDLPIHTITIGGRTWIDASGHNHTETYQDHTVTYSDATCYFTQASTEYQRQSVASELYEYGKNILNDLCHPSYTFSMESANFISLAEFEQFKNILSLGKSVYVELSDNDMLKPICIGISLDWFDPSSLNLEFSDSFASPDKTFRLVDLLEQSISMGRTVDSSKYAYSAYVDSGADAYINTILNSAIDVARTAITSSSNQAITWDDTGLRLRRRLENTEDEYEPEQIWINNNSIIMTTDGWASAEMAIGKFWDANLNTYVWGIAAPRIVGTMIAGSSLIIESAKQSGGTAVFRMDADGCWLYNTDMVIANETRKIIINPAAGIAIGNSDMVYDEDDEDGEGGRDFKQNANLWVDSNGNITLKGAITATSLTILGSGSATIDYTAITNDLNNNQLVLINSIINNYSSENTAMMERLFENLNERLANQSSSISHVFYGTEDTSSAKPGDVWYNTNGKVYKYIGYWTEIYSSATADWLSAVGTSTALADNEITVYNTATNPTTGGSVNVGDIWIKPTTDSYEVLSWNGTQWSSVSDSSLSGFIDELSNYIDETAKVYVGSTENADADIGDIWFNPTAGTIKIKRDEYESPVFKVGSVEYDSLVEGYNNPYPLLVALMNIADGSNKNAANTVKFSATDSQPSDTNLACRYWLKYKPGTLESATISQLKTEAISAQLQTRMWMNLQQLFLKFGRASQTQILDDPKKFNKDVLYNLYNVLYDYYRADTSSNARVPDGSDPHYIIYCIDDLSQVSSVSKDYLFYTRTEKYVYVRRGDWKDITSDDGIYVLSKAVSLMPLGATYLSIYKDSASAESYSNGDIHFDSTTKELGMWDTDHFVVQQGKAEYTSALQSVFTQENNRVLYSASAPVISAMSIGDLWFNYNTNRIYRLTNTTDWEDITADVQAASANISNGTTGINFTDSNNAIVTINQSNGLKAVTPTALGGAYFQVTGLQMGFYDQNDTALFEYRNGRMQFNNAWHAINSGAAGDSGIVSPLESPTAICKSHVDCLAGCGYYVEGNHVYVTVNVKSANPISAQQVVNTGNIPSAYRPSTNVYSVGLCGSGSASGLIVGGVNSYGNVYILQSAIAFDWCDLVIDYVI